MTNATRLTASPPAGISGDGLGQTHSAANEPDAAFDLGAEAALVAIASHDGPIFVDLDETLYLRNSTEDFIDLARPALIAILFLRFLDLSKPWRWTGGDATRDVWRVQLVRFLFPWTLGRWKAAAPRLARTFVNAPLLEVLKRLPTPPIIVTVGFFPIVAPLAAAFGLPGLRVVAARMNTVVDRRSGKLQCVVDTLGAQATKRALLITDSLNDLSLLQACARGVRTVWPDARYRQAFSCVYFPLQYLSQIKRPGEHYFRRAVLQEDYLLWILSSIALASAPLWHVVGLMLLLLSLWVVYEMGYVDNDKVAAEFEEQPTLTDAFYKNPVATPVWQPWIWSLFLAFSGIFVLRWPDVPHIRDFVLWCAGLLGTFGWFALYNRSHKPSRIWMYAVLQFMRAAIFTLLVPIVAVGAMALAAHIMTRWMPYYIYRLQAKSWPMEAHFGIARLIMFIMLSLLLGISVGWNSLVNWSAAALLLWNLLRARKELHAVITNFSRVDRPYQGPDTNDRR